MMDYHCLFHCGVKRNSTETVSTERWKQLETKTNLKAPTGRKELEDCMSMKDVISHYHLSGHFSNLEKERRKKMLKKL